MKSIQRLCNNDSPNIYKCGEKIMKRDKFYYLNKALELAQKDESILKKKIDELCDFIKLLTN